MAPAQSDSLIQRDDVCHHVVPFCLSMICSETDTYIVGIMRQEIGTMRVQMALRTLPGAIVCALALWANVAVAADKPVTIVALGDSLTAGFGLAAADAFPAKLQQALVAKGVAITISNAGVSGDTMSGGLARLDWSVPPDTDAVILELGANDALRGLDPTVTRRALDQILAAFAKRNIPVLLCGMLAPRNLGADYARTFDPMFPDLAKTYDAVLYPFFLDGVAGDPKLNQRDGLHPTAAGVDVIVAKILPKVEELITQVRAKRGL
jgi:acyl-CoA thioesterase I